MKLVLMLYRGTPTSIGASEVAELLKKAKCPKSHYRCSEMVKLELGLHHVNQRGNQREFQSGEIIAWVSL